MAIGDISLVSPDGIWAFELLASTTSNNGAPSGSSAGLAMSVIKDRLVKLPEYLTLNVFSTAGSGTMTVTGRLWGFDPVANDWFPLGTGADADKGKLNAGTALGETSADKIRHSEPVFVPEHFTRLYLETLAIGGTSTAVKAELVGRAQP